MTPNVTPCLAKYNWWRWSSNWNLCWFIASLCSSIASLRFFLFPVFLGQFQASVLLPPGAVACNFPPMKRVSVSSFSLLTLPVMVDCLVLVKYIKLDMYQSIKAQRNVLCKFFKIHYYLPSRVTRASPVCIGDWIESGDSVPVQIKDMMVVD